MKYENIHIKKFFKMMHKKIKEELEKNPNNKISVKITLDFAGDTTAYVEIIKYEGILIPDAGVNHE